MQSRSMIWVYFDILK